MKKGKEKGEKKGKKKEKELFSFLIFLQNPRIPTHNHYI